MTLQKLQEVDSHLKVIFGKEWPEEILAISSLDLIQESGLIFLKNQKFFEKFLKKIDLIVERKNGLIIDEKFYSQLTDDNKKLIERVSWIILTPNLALSLTLLSKPFHQKKFSQINFQVDGRQMGTAIIDPSARISQNVFIGENVHIGPDVVIMPGSVILPNVDISEGTLIHSNVTIYPFSKIGKNCRIHSGVVIGSDGFGYTFHHGEHLKIWHMGGVEIHDYVEIGSNSSVDMGTFSPTIIGEGSKIDNLVQIAHNVKMGKACVICGQAGLAGSVTLEDYVVLGGRAAVGPDAYLGMGTQVAGGGKVSEGSIWPAGSKLGGHPAKDLKEWMRGVAYVRNASLREKK